MRTANVHLTWLFPLLQCIIVGVGGDYRLEIMVHQYRNPTHLQANGDCCEWSPRKHHCMPCHNMFTFCLPPVGTNTELNGYDFNTYACNSHPNYTTGVVSRGSDSTQDSDDMAFARNGFIDEQNHIANPLAFTANGSWPGNFQFVVKIKNRKSLFCEYLVDVIAKEWALLIGETFSQRQLIGLKYHARLTVSARVTCTGEKLCQNCTQICGRLPLGEEAPPRLGDDPGDDEPRSTPGGGGGGDGGRNGSTVNDNPDPGGTDSNTSSQSTNSSGVMGAISGNGTSSQYRLTIGLSVTISLLILLLLTAIVVVCAYIQRRRRGRRHELRSRGEGQPFLQQAGNVDYMSTPGEEDSGGENFSLQSTDQSSRASNLYQPLPGSAPDNGREGHQPRLPRTGNSGARVSYSSNSPVSSGYSIIMRQNVDISPTQSLEDIPEVSEEEEEVGSGDEFQAGYSVIRKEDMDSYVSEDVSDEEEERQREALLYSLDTRGSNEGRGERNNEEEPFSRSGESGYGQRGQELLGNHMGISVEEGERDRDDGEDSSGRNEEEDIGVVENSGWERPRMPTPPALHN